MNDWAPRDPSTLMVATLLGLCLGSFLNVVIYRLPLGQSILWPPSRCGGCGGRIRPWHNVPIVGWFVLRGRCADCRAPISARYPLVEALGALAVLASLYLAPTPLTAAVLAVFSLSLLVVFFVDLDHRIIPDEISLGGTVLGLAISFWTVGWRTALLGAVVGAGALFLVGWLYERTRGRAGMGLGDVKLAGMLGAFLGLPGVVLTVMGAAFLGSIVGGALLAARRATAASALPFGCFLAPAAVATYLYGPRVWAWYLGFFPQSLR